MVPQPITFGRADHQPKCKDTQVLNRAVIQPDIRLDPHPKQRLRVGYWPGHFLPVTTKVNTSRSDPMTHTMFAQSKQVLWVELSSPSGLIRAIGFLQLNLTLTQNIRTRTLNPKITDPSVQECINQTIKPDPVLTDLVSRDCSKDN
ncbi:hypothetical protein HYC85_024593 [Camellia sinensis]|uniref:Uncharacterized protein n=1 Tax=Camellia sinensis TaxID=4442 RepID=A0A7J7G960_CAMSI|nr:hypothetical protein HYC85_024593 [Camellia sinensis]